ncbi:MAG: histidine phosphatase family protein [Patescibacteria group bacterium]
MNESIEDITSEEKINPPEQIVVYTVRHGNTNYIGTERDLTKEGEQQVIKTANELAEKIDKDKDIVIVVESPTKRTQYTGKIIREVLESKGIEVFKERGFYSIRDRIKDPNKFLDKYTKRGMEKGDLEGTVKSLGQLEFRSYKDKRPEETYEEMYERTQSAIIKLVKVASSMDWEGKKPVIIMAGHALTSRGIVRKAGLTENGLDSDISHASCVKLEFRRGNPEVKVSFHEEEGTIRLNGNEFLEN